MKVGDTIVRGGITFVAEPAAMDSTGPLCDNCAFYYSAPCRQGYVPLCRTYAGNEENIIWKKVKDV